MPNIGLYDIDLFHSPKKFPNFQLMKIYNYCCHNNEMVTMIRPTDTDLGRFTHIIYFKDWVNNNFPKHQLNNKEKNIITYGYGFYSQEIPLIDKYYNSPPSLEPYDLFSEKFSEKRYELFKRSSFIHFGTNDFSGFNSNFKNIYLVDHNIGTQPGISDFFHEYHNYNFYFYHTPTATSIEMYEQLEKFEQLFKQKIRIKFKYNKDFILKYGNSPEYPPMLLPGETDYERDIRLLKTVIILKSMNISSHIVPYGSSDISKKIIQYANDSAVQDSFYNYFQNDKEALRMMLTVPSELRLLFKTKPKSGIIDF